MVKKLEEIWFFPAPAARLALLRIFVGLFAVYYVGPRFSMFSAMGRSSPTVFEPIGLATLLHGPMSPQIFDVLLVATLVANAAFILGFLHRLTGPAFGILLFLTLTYRNSWSMIYHNDNVLVFHALILGFAPAADALSIDAWRRKRKSRTPRRNLEGDWRFGWPISLMCLVTALTYFLSAMAKLAGPLGWAWIDGEAMRGYLAVDGLRKELLGEGASPLIFALYDYVGLFTMLAAVSLVIELGALPALLHRSVARAWAIYAFFMHWGIVYLMGINFPYYTYGIIFLPYFQIERLLDVVKGTTAVLYDGRCGMCRTSRRWAGALDWFRRVAWLDFRAPEVRALVPGLNENQLENEMWVITPDGQMLPGFRGWRRLLGVFPLSLLPSLLLHIPPVPFFGDVIYKWIARRRHITCELEPESPIPAHRPGWRETLQKARGVRGMDIESPRMDLVTEAPAPAQSH